MTQAPPDPATQQAWKVLANNPQDAERLFRESLVRNPDNVSAKIGLTTIAVKFGLPQGEEMIQRLLTTQPDEPRVHYMVGNLRHAQGRFDEAIAAYRKALSLATDYMEAQCNLGDTLCCAGRYEESIAVLRRGSSRFVSSPQMRFNLGNVLWITGEHDEAIAAYQMAVKIQPNNPGLVSVLASALRERGRLAESIECYHRAIELEPSVAAHVMNLSVTVDRTGDAERAIALCRKAIAMKPDYADAHSNLGVYLTLTGRYDEGVEYFQRAVELAPGYAQGHFHFALASLMHGDFARGWAEYEWRWKTPNFPSPQRPFTEPQWTGGQIPAGATTILLHGEQGLGDTLQFARFVPIVAARGWRVVLEVQPGLTRLIEMSGRLSADVLRERTTIGRSHLPSFDCHVPMASLPLALGELEPSGDSFPRAPYLRVSDELNGQWRDRVDSAAPGAFKIGLCWAGSPTHHSDGRRSVSLATLAPLAKFPATFFSLQIGPSANQARTPPTGMALVDLTSEITDFADTAAIMNSLDLIISVDTAVVHLAGALGRPCWILVPLVPDWRWQFDRTDSPWYPGVRLFRRSRGGDWAGVVGRIAGELETLLATKREKELPA